MKGYLGLCAALVAPLVMLSASVEAAAPTRASFNGVECAEPDTASLVFADTNILSLTYPGAAAPVVVVNAPLVNGTVSVAWPTDAAGSPVESVKWVAQREQSTARAKRSWTAIRGTTAWADVVDPALNAGCAAVFAPGPNPLNIRLNGFDCDEYMSMSGWVAMLTVTLRHDGAAEVPVSVTYGPPGGPYLTSTMLDLNPGETFGFAYVPWPWTTPTGPVFQDEVYVRVEYEGQMVLEETYTHDDVRSVTPVCAAVLDTPGVVG